MSDRISVEVQPDGRPRVPHSSNGDESTYIYIYILKNVFRKKAKEEAEKSNLKVDKKDPSLVNKHDGMRKSKIRTRIIPVELALGD